VAGFDAVVMDLDGTVIRRDGAVSEATLHAAQVLKERGVPLLAATARTPAGVDTLHTLSPFLTFAVCCSGAVGPDRRPLPRSRTTGPPPTDRRGRLVAARYESTRSARGKRQACPASRTPPHADHSPPSRLYARTIMVGLVLNQRSDSLHSSITVTSTLTWT
jgi:hypothetical protein